MGSSSVPATLISPVALAVTVFLYILERDLSYYSVKVCLVNIFTDLFLPLVDQVSRFYNLPRITFNLVFPRELC